MVTVLSLTESLKQHAGEFVFNPAIVQLKDNLYLVSYRAFRRYGPEVEFNHNIEGTTDSASIGIFTPTHPWAGGPKYGTRGTQWTYTSRGFDGTRFAFLDYRSDIPHTIDVPVLLPGVDARLVDLTPPALTDGTQRQLLITYNVGVDPTSDPRIRVCPTKRYAQIMAAMSITVDMINLTLTFNQDPADSAGNLFCQEISGCTEKNWSFWAEWHGDVPRLRFAYHIAPMHQIYTLTGSRCEDGYSLTQAPSKLLVEFLALYNDLFFISLSTPPHKMPGSPLLCGVGHIKILWEPAYARIMNKTVDPNLPMWKHLATVLPNAPRLHFTFVYMMFIYFFDPATATIWAVSDMFTIDNSPLVFPVGLTVATDGALGITYGDMDEDTLVAEIPYTVWGSLMHDVNSADPMDESVDIAPRIRFVNLPITRRLSATRSAHREPVVIL